jgi:two-component system NtrC family sensor kinase
MWSIGEDPDYYIAVVEDISERKLIEEALRKSHEELAKAYDELKSAQVRVLHQEKMASIGQLAAGVAHEINNPIGFISSNLNSLRRYTDKIAAFSRMQLAALENISGNGDSQIKEILDEIREQKKSIKFDYIVDDLGNIIDESLDGANRVRGIVRDLKSFSRSDESEFKMADINAGIESTINIVWNELKYKATLEKEFGDIPPTKCNIGQLNQVFMNILVNASHAIPTQGTITVKTRSADGNIYVAIADTGTGIPAETLGKIFDPFFTTKEVGKGTGLGLSIAYDIIKKHKGEIKVDSEVGKGTSFTISIPIVED